MKEVLFVKENPHDCVACLPESILNFKIDSHKIVTIDISSDIIFITCTEDFTTVCHEQEIRVQIFLPIKVSTKFEDCEVKS